MLCCVVLCRVLGLGACKGWLGKKAGGGGGLLRRLRADVRGQFIASKTKAALDGGLGVILCVGESLEVCVAGKHGD